MTEPSANLLDDPYYVAGPIACRRCDAVRFPDEAEWLDLAASWLLVFYDSPCAHVRPAYCVVDGDDGRCTGTTRTGERCRRYTQQGGRCWQHPLPRRRRRRTGRRGA